MLANAITRFPPFGWLSRLWAHYERFGVMRRNDVS